MWLPVWLGARTEWKDETLRIIERKLFWWHLCDCAKAGIGLGILYIVIAAWLDLPGHFAYISRYLYRPLDAYEYWVRLGWFLVACPVPVANPILPAFAGYLSVRVTMRWSGVCGWKAVFWGAAAGGIAFQAVTLLRLV